MKEQGCGGLAARRHGVSVLELIAAAACVAIFGVPLLAAEEAPAEPALVGAASPDQILKISADWKANYDAYTPDAAAVEKIRQAAGLARADLGIEVIFGSWCSDSRDQLPRFLKVLDQAGKDAIAVTFLGVHKAKTDRDARVTDLKITAIPTFIVSLKGAEVGRIVETPKATIEEDLAEILLRPAKP